MASYSIHQHFSGGSVLITGASGYVGGLVVEKLLRCTGIDTVYVLMRAKKGSDIQTRLSSMLNSSPLFHLLRDNPVLSKVKAIEGDMTAAPQLGISSEDLQLLQQTVHTVIHCAADIRMVSFVFCLLCPTQLPASNQPLF
jgi:fatty acyl-CoA reductase